MTQAAQRGDPNIIILEAMVKALGELSDAVVFVGGCSTGLLVTSVQAQPIRVTKDVDVVVQVASTRECELAPLWSHLTRGLMEPPKSRANGASQIAA